MKLNFRSKKINLNLQKNHHIGERPPSNKGNEAQDVAILGYPHPTKIPASSFKTGQNKQPERIQLEPTKQNYLSTLSQTIQLIGSQYIHYLNDGKQERLNSMLLANLTKLQPRDRHIIIEYDYKKISNPTGSQDHQNSQNFEFDFATQQPKFKQWLGQLHFRIISTSFNFQINNLLTYEEVKVYCSQNLLLNIILFLQKVQKNLKVQSLPKFMHYINNVIKDNLEYLLMKYPQVKQTKANKKLRSIIQPINNLDNDSNDMFRHSGIELKYNQQGDYNSEIMKFINYLIQKMNERVTIEQTQHSSYVQGFYQIIEQIFQSVYLSQSDQYKYKKQFNLLFKQPQQQSEQQQKQDNYNVQPKQTVQAKQQKEINLKDAKDNYKKKIDELFEKDYQMKEYKEKIMKYTSWKIGTKINPNTELFSKGDIKSGYFQVKNTVILRILTKWIEQLEIKIFKAKQHVQKRSFRFKNNQKGFTKLNSSQKNDLFIEATKQVKNLKAHIEEIRQNAFSIEGQFALLLKRNLEHLNIPRNQFFVGQYSSKLEDAASSSLLSYLNRIIHVLLQIPKNLQPKYEHDQDLLKEMDINLITFKISDLLRCKIQSHENEILRIYKKLKQLSQQKKYFKIVRIKDRLDMGTKDILININYNNTFLCEIQLAIKDTNQDQKQQTFDSFNHFLYELKRSNLGPLMESACIWAHYDQRSKIFKKIKQKQIEELSGKTKQTKINHPCYQESLVENSLPFICSLCSKFYFTTQGIIKHKKCQQCKKFYECALCLQNKLTDDQLKKFLKLDVKLGKFVNNFEQWNTKNDPKQDYPDFGLIIPKKNKDVEILFFVTILWKQDAYLIRTYEYVDSSDKNVRPSVEIQIITKIKGNQLNEWRRLKQAFIIYEWKQKKHINLTIKPEKIKQQQAKQKEREQKKKQQQKMKIQKAKEQFNKKWKIKRQDKEKDKDKQKKSQRSHSASSKNSQSSKPASRQASRKGKRKQNEQQKKKHLEQQAMDPIQEKGEKYFEEIAKRSDLFEFRIARITQKQQENEYQRTYYLVLGPFMKQGLIRAKLKKMNNEKIIQSNLQKKMDVILLQQLQIEDELESFEPQNYENSLSKINQIYLNENLIQSIPILQAMPNLKIVQMNYNQIDDLEYFGKLKELQELVLEYNEINEITNLDNCKQLIELNLNHNFIVKIQGLNNQTNLEVLSIGNNQIYSIKEIQKLTSLKKLDLSCNRITSMKHLINLYQLQELDLSDNSISLIQSLQKMDNLKKLKLKRNKIVKISGLQKLYSLKILDLHRNMIMIIENLGNLKFLTNLNLSGNKIKIIESLQDNVELIDLDLSTNQIDNLQKLLELSLANKKLKKLNLSYNGIKGLPDLAGIKQFLKNLEQLYLFSNPLRHSKKQHHLYQQLKTHFLNHKQFQFKIDSFQMNDHHSDSQDQIFGQPKIKQRRK